MPTVPIYNAPQVSPQPLPGVRQQVPNHLMTAATLGSQQTEQMGRGLLTAGAEMMREITAQQIQTNEARAKEHDANIMGDIQGILYGTGDDPNSGYMNQKGKNAVDTWGVTVEKLTQVMSDRSKDLDNPAQQEAVQVPTQMRIQAAIAQAAQHRAQQNDVYQLSAGETRIRVAQDGAAQSFNPITDKATPDFNHDSPANNSLYQQYLKTVDSEANDLADRKGLTDPDLRKALVKGAMEKAYLGVLGHMLDKKGASLGDVKVAQTYFDSVKGELSTEAQDKVKAVLDTTSRLSAAQAVSDDVYAKYGKDESRALEEIRKIQDPDVRQKALSITKERYNDDQRITERNQRDADNQGLLTLTNGGSLRSLMNSDTWGQMSAHAQRQAEEWVRQNQLHNAQINQIDKMNDLVALQKIIQLRQDNPAQFANLDMVKTAKELGIKNPATIKQLIETQASYNKGDAAEATFNTAFRNAKILYAPLLPGVGLAVMPTMSKEQKEGVEQNRALFESTVQQNIQQYMKDNGNKIPDGKVLNSIIQQSLTPMHIHDTGSWFGLGEDQTKLMGAMTPEERSRAYIISAEDLSKQNPSQYSQLYNALKAKLGRNPSRVEIENQYTSMMLLMKGK